ncbi:DUF2142 domain-containing protein [Agromyces sp. NPDC058136]|uniref:DUF2142 domain-containing protein n=1 Tax=Agromyces sp. NPDC058136 TaxID=3346354 RepID=UPI0036D7FA40
MDRRRARRDLQLNRKPRPGRPSTAPTFWIAFAIFGTLAILWSLASPVFSVPDENAHATKAVAQVRGQVIGYTVPGVKHIVVDLPEGFEYDTNILCFATQPTRSAECGGAEFGAGVGTSTFNTWVGAYNPIYYYLVGWPSLFTDGNAAVYAMRIASSLLGALMLAAAFQVSVAGKRARWMPLALAFVAAPMNLYLLGSVNPNGAELGSAILLWAALLRLLETFDRRAPSGVDDEGATLPRWYLWAMVTVASVILVNARALGPLWLVVIVGLCFIASGWPAVRGLFTNGRSYIWLSAIALGGLFSLGWTLSGGSLSNQAEPSDAPLVGATFLQGFLYTVRMTPHFLQQAIGYFGWLDTPLPVAAYWLFVAAFGVLLLLVFAAARRRSMLVLGSVLLAAFLVPALVQGYSVGQTGIIWQGRYALFLYIGIAIVAGWLLSRDAPRIGFLARRMTWVAAGLLALYGVVAFTHVMVRYVVGEGAALSTMFSAPQWQPPLGWLTLVIAYAVASLALLAFVGLTARSIVRREESAVDD